MSLYGWNFSRRIEGPVKLKDSKDAFEGGNDVLEKAFHDMVGYLITKGANGVERWSQTLTSICHILSATKIIRLNAVYPVFPSILSLLVFHSTMALMIWLGVLMARSARKMKKSNISLRKIANIARTGASAISPMMVDLFSVLLSYSERACFLILEYLTNYFSYFSCAVVRVNVDSI